MISLQAALTRPGLRIAAWDRYSGNAPTLRIVALEGGRADVIVREPIAPGKRAAIEQQLREHGIATGATYRTCGFVWMINERHAGVWKLGDGVTLVAGEGHVRAAGQKLRAADVCEVVSFCDDDDIGHRGVRLMLDGGASVVAAEERDETPQFDPSYGRTNLEIDGGWIVYLGRELAAHLGVPHRDELWGTVTPPPSARPASDPATAALVDGLIEAFWRYDDPDRVAAREAREAEKDARDAPILELSYIKTGQRGDLPVDVAVRKMLDHFAGELAKVPDTRTGRQPLPELDNGGYIVLSLANDALVLEAESPSGENKASETVRRGSPAELVAFLRSPASAGAVVALMERLTEAVRARESSQDARTIIGGPRAKARNTHEMRFFVSLEDCPACQHRLDSERFDYSGGSETGAALSGKCGNCLKPLGFSFLGDNLLNAASGNWDELAPGRTEIIVPSKLAAELERLTPEIRDDPARLEPVDWQLNRELNKRALLCAHELAKLLDDGATGIADELLSPAEREQRAAHPAWFQRAWIESALARHRGIVQANVADLPRVNKLEAEAARLRPKGSDYLDQNALRAHERWVERGKQGKGRLVLVKAKQRHLKVGRGIEMSGAQLYEVDLPDVYLEDVKLAGAELTKVRMTEGRLYAAILKGATVTGSTFKKADLSLAELGGARLSDTDFSGANLELTQWAGTIVERCRFDQAVFSNAELDGVTFRGCSFRGARFAPADPNPAPATRGARFEDCDLRGSTWQGRDLSGAAFVSCKLGGISGAPAAASGIVIEGADLAEDDGASRPASAAEVLARWGLAPS